jgi:hypothetical protein
LAINRLEKYVEYRSPGKTLFDLLGMKMENPSLIMSTLDENKPRLRLLKKGEYHKRVSDYDIL